MWETAQAFAIWGSYGSVLTAARIDPVLAALMFPQIQVCSAKLQQPATPLLLSGVVLVLAAIAASVQFTD